MPREQAAIVRSVFDEAIREINDLELRIVEAEDDTDAKLWKQAKKVAEQLEAGMSQQELASQWINLRTGEPYTQAHVSYTAKVFRNKYTYKPRPRFRDAYNEIANSKQLTAHVAHNSGDNEWYTPAAYIEAAREVLGDIDLDPASSKAANEIVKAASYYSADDDGLEQAWHGRVWMNPPYAQPLIDRFAKKWSGDVQAGDVTESVVLVNNATETEWFAALTAAADAVCFPKGRIRFWSPEKDSAAPLQGQALLYAGPKVDEFCRRFAEFGTVARLVRRETNA